MTADIVEPSAANVILLFALAPMPVSAQPRAMPATMVTIPASLYGFIDSWNTTTERIVTHTYVIANTG